MFRVLTHVRISLNLAKIVPVTCPYPGPAQSSPHTHIPHPGDPS